MATIRTETLGFECVPRMSAVALPAMTFASKPHTFWTPALIVANDCSDVLAIIKGALHVPNLLSPSYPRFVGAIVAYQSKDV